MRISVPEISKQIYKKEVLSALDSQYSEIGPMWIAHQVEWVNGVYKSFKNHDKFMIVIYLIKKTLDFYSRNFTKLSYDEFYSKDTTEIEKFSINDIAINLNIPKESARRKILELEESLVIKKYKKKIIIDRSSYSHFKPIESIVRISRFLSTFSNILYRQKILQKKFSSGELENIIKENFSYIWKLYYEFQIPMMIGYKKKFGDLESLHIYSTCVINQHLYLKKEKKDIKKRSQFIKSMSSIKMQGVNAMSISDITGIPRATVIRKLKKMVESKKLSINENKHYKITDYFTKKLIPYQNITLNGLSEFITQVFNLSLLNQSVDKKDKDEYEVPFYLKEL